MVHRYLLNRSTVRSALSIFVLGKCKTVSGPSSGENCVLPFKFNGVFHMACTTNGNEAHEERPWCSTKVTEIGEHIEGQGNWGLCGPKCPFDDIASTTG